MLTVQDNIVSKSIRKYRIHIFRGYVIFALAAFSILAFLARQFPYFPFDPKITLAIQQINSPIFDTLMKLITLPGNGPQSFVIIVVTIIAIFQVKLRWEAICVAINTTGFLLLSSIFKILVERSRPAHDLVKVFVQLKDPSFPSGHVLSYTSILGFLGFLIYILMPKSRYRSALLILLASLVILIGPSRIYLGEHWFSDTLGAYILGSVWVVMTIQIYFWGRSKFFKKDPSVIPAEISDKLQK